uniref:Subtilisin-like protease 2 n=1 Tax=Onygena corvina TaxID=180788 RepID=A0A0B4VM94_9EURO|nr:subtilisin-like protease 2 [Onygena corvina]
MQLFSLLLLVPFVAAAEPQVLKTGPKGIVPGRYIVTLKDGLSASQIASHKEWLGSVHQANLNFAANEVEQEGLSNHFNIHKLNIYAGGFDEKTVNDLRNSPYVKSVVPDQLAYVTVTTTQRQTGWNLGYLSSKGKPVRNWDTKVDYSYDSKAGEGIWAYVLDTGTNINHVEFEGRGILGYNAHKDKPHEDTFGHGTYVGGLIAGKTFGVAKKANVVSCKAFDSGSVPYRYILDTYDWIVKNITDTNRKNKAVINLSITSEKFQPFDDAVENAFQAGITTVCASGNDGRDAGMNTPASSPNAITVGALRFENTRPSFSNWGKVVDIHAPGEIIKSAWKGSNTASSIQSGTSAASPHVAGMVAYLMSIENFSSPSAVTARVLSLAIPGVVKDVKDSANKVAYNGIQERLFSRSKVQQ